MLSQFFKHKRSILIFVGIFILVEIIEVLTFSYTEVIGESTTKNFWTPISNILYLPVSSLLGSFFLQEPFVIPNALLINPLIWALLVTLLSNGFFLIMKRHTK